MRVMLTSTLSGLAWICYTKEIPHARTHHGHIRVMKGLIPMWIIPIDPFASLLSLYVMLTRTVSGFGAKNLMEHHRSFIPIGTSQSEGLHVI